MKLLTKRIKALPLGTLRSFLQRHVEVWRNTVKHRLEDFIKRFIFPLKELDTEGRLYHVFLEDFADLSVANRTFSVISDCPVYGGFKDAFYKL